MRARRVRALALMKRLHRSSYYRCFLLGVALALVSCLAGANGADALTAASPPSRSTQGLAFCPALACLAAVADAARDRGHEHIDGNFDSSSLTGAPTTTTTANPSAARRVFDCIGRRLFGPFEDAMRTRRRETSVVHTCGGTSSARIDADV